MKKINHIKTVQAKTERINKYIVEQLGKNHLLFL